ncbi:hypothetical protein SAMN04487934_101461 [Eubacterium ruminantium]|nr:hypothetical protein SAMN04487934_101461 [Eubacterium ruminantium]
MEKKKDSKGSGIILVIVALSFLGIIAGALLTAVAYAYRLKVVDYNTKDNFHFVEQAMDEVYAGLGGRTTTKMQEAYTQTVEEMVEFDISKRAYVNIGDTEANRRFKDYFMNGIKDDIAFASVTTLTELVQSYISNDSVKVVSDNLRVEFYDVDGNIKRTVNSTGGDGSIEGIEIGKIVIRNLVLRRTANYSRNSANGSFTQTISTDVEISRPDFNVKFNTVDANKSTIFDYCMVADSGIEINQSAAIPLAINGNIYGGADFYNKSYNLYGVSNTDTIDAYTKLQTISAVPDGDGKVKDVTVRMQPVTNRVYASADSNTLFNARLADVKYGNGDGILTASELGSVVQTDKSLVYNGYNENSRYSGLFINGAKVSIRANTIVVPGSLAVMNGADLTVYSSVGTKVSNTNLWADNVILGGYTVPGATVDSQKGSSATFVANMYVKDDLEVNSDNSNFNLIGGYYGYGNGTQVKRTFAPTILLDNNGVENKDKLGINIYQQGDAPATATDRSHYNSSSIVVNGNNSNLDFSNTTNLFVAGQAYIELSAKHEDMTIENGEIKYASDSSAKQDVVKDVISYDGRVQDYKTGESISIKSNQLIYIPNGSGTYEEAKDAKGNYYLIAINSMLLVDDASGYNMFKAFFADTSKVPCVGITPANSTRKYYYYDFERIFAQDSKGYESPEAMAAAFAKAYMDELNKSSSEASTNYSPIKDYLDEDVTSGLLYNAGTIIKPDETATGAKTYASGAITEINKVVTATSSKNSYNIYLKKDSGITRPTSADGDTSAYDTGSSAGTLGLASEFDQHYSYLKFALTDLAEGSAEANFIDDIVADADYGTPSLSPINRYFTIPDWEVSPNGTDDTDHVLKLSSGYKVWVSKKDVVIKESDCEVINGLNTVRGVIITTGDVYFTDAVNKFEGLIVAGDKIFVGGNMKTISANPEICKAIIAELQTDKDIDAEKVLRTFNGYSTEYDELSLEDLRTLCSNRGISYTESDTKANLISELLKYDKNGDDTIKQIDTIDYSDVVKYSNWMKNAE